MYYICYVQDLKCSTVLQKQAAFHSERSKARCPQQECTQSLQEHFEYQLSEQTNQARNNNYELEDRGPYFTLIDTYWEDRREINSLRSITYCGKVWKNKARGTPVGNCSQLGVFPVPLQALFVRTLLSWFIWASKIISLQITADMVIKWASSACGRKER